MELAPSDINVDFSTQCNSFDNFSRPLDISLLTCKLDIVELGGGTVSILKMLVVIFVRNISRDLWKRCLVCETN